MGMPRQTTVLLQTARQLVRELPADAVLLLTETNLDWDAVLEQLPGCRLLVAAQDGVLTKKLKDHPGLQVLDIVKNKRTAELWDASYNLDQACESCHLQYWYPGDPALLERVDRQLRELYEQPSPAKDKRKP